MIRTFIFSCLLIFFSFSSFANAPTQTDVVIVGAGLSGLSTAYELKKLGIRYHILELTPHIGGRVKTVKYNIKGETITSDSGMEEYWEGNPALDMMRELKLKLRGDVAMSSIVLDGKQYEFVEENQKEFVSKIFSKDELDKLQALKTKIHDLIERLKKLNYRPDQELMKLKDISFADWIQNQKVPKKVQEWVRVSVECEVGTEWSAISALEGIDEFEIFLGDGARSYRVVHGNEIFTTALTKNIGRQNITTNQRVTKITNVGDEVIVNYLDGNTNTNKVIKAKHVVTTIPLYRLNMEVQLEPALSPKKLEAISSQTYGSYFKVHIFVPKSAEKFWMRDGETILPYLTDSQVGVVYEGNPDQNSKTKIISLLVTGHQAEAYNFMNQDQVRDMIKAGFEKLWPGFSKEFIGMEFYRYHPRAIASWPVGRSRFDDLSEELRRPENRLYLAGDFTEGTHSAGAIKSAYRVVKQIKQKEDEEKLKKKNK